MVDFLYSLNKKGAVFICSGISSFGMFWIVAWHPREVMLMFFYLPQLLLIIFEKVWKAARDLSVPSSFTSIKPSLYDKARVWYFINIDWRRRWRVRNKLLFTCEKFSLFSSVSENFSSQIFLATKQYLLYGCYNNTCQDKAWWRTLVVTIQFIRS